MMKLGGNPPEEGGFQPAEMLGQLLGLQAREAKVTDRDTVANHFARRSLLRGWWGFWWSSGMQNHVWNPLRKGVMWMGGAYPATPAMQAFSFYTERF